MNSAPRFYDATPLWRKFLNFFFPVFNHVTIEKPLPTTKGVNSMSTVTLEGRISQTNFVISLLKEKADTYTGGDMGHRYLVALQTLQNQLTIMEHRNAEIPAACKSGRTNSR